MPNLCSECNTKLKTAFTNGFKCNLITFFCSRCGEFTLARDFVEKGLLGQDDGFEKLKTALQTIRMKNKRLESSENE